MENSLKILLSSQNLDDAINFEENELLDEQATVIREKNTKTAILKVANQALWDLYAGPSALEIDYTTPVLSGNRPGTYPIPVSNKKRSYFAFDSRDEISIFAERVLPLAGGYNFRDLGGLRNRHGRKTKWGLLFRADELDKLTPEDLAYLSAIPLTSVIDFRSNYEINLAPDKLPSSVKKHLLLSIVPGEIDVDMIEKAMKEAVLQGTDELMKEIYAQLVTDKSVQEALQEFFAYLQNPENLPLVFHCTAGKDRTGLAAALLLSALDLDEQTVMQDYLASSVYLAGKYPQGIDIFTVKPEYLEVALFEIDDKYGSIENYLTRILGADLDILREIYLED